MEEPSVHIVILNWNGIDDTLECLASIREMTYENVRVHVVDNGSRADERTPIIEQFPEVNVIALAENSGFCGGCNIGMRTALDEGADLVMLLNNDTLVSKTLIEDLLAGYWSLENVGAVSPVILKYPETDTVWFSKATWEANWKSGETRFRLSDGESYEELMGREPYPSEFACGCCLLVSADVIEKIGMFDERYFAFFDEAEWCARMHRSGLESYVIPTATIFHKVGSSVPNLVMTYLMSRNRMLLISENMPFEKRLRAYLVMAKEFSWHFLNLAGLIPKRKQYVARKFSRVALRGLRDYLLGKVGKWDRATEGIIFDRS